MKNENQIYSSIIEKLKEFNTDSELIKKNIYVNWFFIPKPHPLYLNKYLETSLLSKIFRLTLNLIKIIISLLKSLFSIKNFKSKNEFKNYDLVFISHLISNKKIFENDIYFKDIYKHAKNKNSKVLFIYLNHNKNISPEEINSNENYIFFNKNLNLVNEIICIYKLFKLFFFYLSQKKISKHYKLDILLDVLSIETLINLRIERGINNIARKIKTKKLVCTFEGFNFEKIIFNTIKKYIPKVDNIGYQHAPVLKNQYAIYELQSSNYFPNKILTSGDYYTDILKKKIKDIDIFTFGSSKFGNNKKNNYKKENICLVLPEAIIGECEILFKFTLDYSHKYNDLKFIWRLHPLFDFELLLKKINLNFNNNSKIILSENKNSDFEISKYCLFRGSSSVIEAISAESYPIYLDLINKININPLSNEIDIKNVQNISDLNKIISSEGRENHQARGSKIDVNKYFLKPEYENLKIL